MGRLWMLHHKQGTECPKSRCFGFRMGQSVQWMVATSLCAARTYVNSTIDAKQPMFPLINRKGAAHAFIPDVNGPGQKKTGKPPVEVGIATFIGGALKTGFQWMRHTDTSPRKSPLGIAGHAIRRRATGTLKQRMSGCQNIAMLWSSILGGRFCRMKMCIISTARKMTIALKTWSSGVRHSRPVNESPRRWIGRLTCYAGINQTF